MNNNTTENPIEAAREAHQHARRLANDQTSGQPARQARIPAFTLFVSMGLMTLDSIWLYHTRGTPEFAAPALLMCAVGAYILLLMSESTKAG